MALPSIYESATTEATLKRLSNLTHTSAPLWGKMNVAQMLAHVNVSYDLAYGHTPTNKGGFMMQLMLKLFIKKIVTNEKPYPRNSRTGPQFIIADERDFEKEKAKLIEYVKLTQSKGAAYFEGRENGAFGVLTATEWNNMFYKHIDHHFSQFGV